MPAFGFHASHEQVHPSELLAAVQRAEDAGFDAAMSSDHFSPWSERQGESGFAWSWLGAAMATTALPFGVVTAPGQRYHPAITAQAIATLLEMFPDRLWVALGTGEASNEHITGDRWPDKATRTARLGEVVRVLRALFAGEEVTHHGLTHTDRARVLESFRSVAGDEPPAYLQVHVSWAPTYAEALAIAHDQWRTNVFAAPVCWDLELPAHFDEAARFVRPEDVARHVVVASDPAEHAERLDELVALGFDGVWVHHVGRDQRAFIDVYGEHVLPRLRAGVT